MDDSVRGGFFEVDVDDVAACLEHCFHLPQRERGFACGGEPYEGVPDAPVEESDAVFSFGAHAWFGWRVGAVEERV